ncbi:MAG: hypothetical protein JWP31_589 [Aeromicrobium sp.]|nr:hypothetical protein [Aeromicrobium sp.]
MADQHAAPQQSSGPLAGWGSRVGASIIDAIPTIAALVLFSVLFGESDASDSGFQLSLSGLPALVYFLLAFGWFFFNWGYLQGRTGQTVGKKVLGITVGGATHRSPIGFGLSIGRQFVHILDAIPCYLGFLWPLWDKANRTWADMILDTRVYKV